MEKFCTSCGSPIEEGLAFCTSCGKRIEPAKEEQPATTESPKEQTPERAKKEPKAYTKKQKVLFTSIAGIIVLFIGLYMWGNSYYSPEKTAERLMAAIVDEDVAAVQDVTTINGERISEGEAQAFIALANDSSTHLSLEDNTDNFIYYNDLFTLEEDGNAFLLFTRHRFSLVPQYASLEVPFEGIEFNFNNEEIRLDFAEEYHVVYGPMAPGKYTLNGSFSGEFTEAEDTSEMILADAYGDSVHHDVEMDAEYVAIQLHNESGIPIERAFIEINEDELEFDDALRIENFGPLNLDGSLELTPIFETRWGTIEGDAIPIDEHYHEVTIHLAPDELTEELADTILLYGEEYVDAHAASDEELFTTVTADLKDSFGSNFESYRDLNQSFTGQLDSIEIDFNQLSYNDSDDIISLVSKFYFTSAFHSDDQEPELEDRVDHVTMEFVYDTDSETWLVDYSSEVGMWSYDNFTATTTLDGSGEKAEATQTASAPSEDGTDEEVEDVTLSYISNLVEAINANDYDLVRPYIKEDSPLHDMQVDLVNRLNENGTTQEVVQSEVANIEANGDGWIVETNETITIIYESGDEDTNDYTWYYSVESDGDGLALTNIAETADELD